MNVNCYLTCGLFDWLNNLFQPIKKPVRTLSIFKSMAFVKDVKGISFKNRLKGHINWRKVRHFNEKKINQKFVWLKVASINISRSTVSDCAPFLVVPFLFDVKGISFKNRLKGHINWRKVRHFNVI
jgi:macrodomain Ter protein organizer (MatP/YcbG family)